MDKFESEKIVLTPAAVLKRAKELTKAGCYKAAYDLIDENKVEVEVYNDNSIQMSIQNFSWSDNPIPKRRGMTGFRKKYGTVRSRV